ncbi:hypothetical protein HY468_04410 [Candidatus Roizmanbacteria bacterium]|nr:hypothetical protein [Candidatus Roizmanbacteria bacterium]
MFDKFFNFYSKYPWVAIVILAYWLMTAYMIITSSAIDTTIVLGIAFFSTVVFAYFGFNLPKG